MRPLHPPVAPAATGGFCFQPPGFRRSAVGNTAPNIQRKSPLRHSAERALIVFRFAPQGFLFYRSCVRRMTVGLARGVGRLDAIRPTGPRDAVGRGYSATASILQIGEIRKTPASLKTTRRTPNELSHESSESFAWGMIASFLLTGFHESPGRRRSPAVARFTSPKRLRASCVDRCRIYPITASECKVISCIPALARENLPRGLPLDRITKTLRPHRFARHQPEAVALVQQSPASSASAPD